MLNDRANTAVFVSYSTEIEQEEKRQRDINLAFDMWLMLMGRENTLSKSSRQRLVRAVSEGINYALMGKQITPSKNILRTFL